MRSKGTKGGSINSWGVRRGYVLPWLKTSTRYSVIDDEEKKEDVFSMVVSCLTLLEGAVAFLIFKRGPFEVKSFETFYKE